MTRVFFSYPFFFSLILGVLTVAGFAPVEFFPLPLVTLALLFLQWHRADTPRQAALSGFAWGMGLYLVGVSWVYVSLHDVGGMAMLLAALAALLLAAYLSLFPAIVAYVFKRFSSAETWPDMLLLAGLWLLSEWLRGYLFTGFPWLAIGYSQTPPSPLAGYAPLIGVYGVGFVLVLLSAMFAFGWRRRGAMAAATVIVVGGIGLHAIRWTQPFAVPITVSLIQGNIPQSLKWDPTRLDLSLRSYQRLAEEHPAQLVVLPETAIPLLFDQIPHDYLMRLAREGNLLLGTLMPTSDDGYVNGAMAMDKGGPIGMYAKTHLVPFGEYVPPGFAWFFDWVRIPMTDFSTGQKVQPPLDIAGQKVGVNICFEDLFGEQIIRALPEATLLINLSNTAWFGHSLAQPQHLQIARMRAMETGRPMLRATNTGMTASISPDGTVLALLPEFVADGLTVTVQGYSGATPFVCFGNLSGLLLAAAAILPTIAFRRRRR